MVEIKDRYTGEVLLTIKGADLVDADLVGAYLVDANLKAVKLRGADLEYANLRGADLVDADLVDADLVGADLNDADLRGAKLEYAKGIKSFQCGDYNRVSYAVKWNNCVMFKIGCFWGDTEQAIEKVRGKYGDNSYYEKLIKLYTEMLNEEN